MTFSDFRAHSSPLFYKLTLLKFQDIIFLNNALFMYNFYGDKLPSVFKDFFISIDKIHHYNTRLVIKKSYYLPKIRTNYGKFNIRFVGAKIWNSIQERFKSESRHYFKKVVASSLLENY